MSIPELDGWIFEIQLIAKNPIYWSAYAIAEYLMKVSRQIESEIE
jgi:hypothetical protein